MSICNGCGKENEIYDLTYNLCRDCYDKKCNQIKSEVDTKAIKSDNGKPRLDLVPLEILEPLARVREFALSKYGESGIQNWAQIEDKRYLAALLRHLVAYQKDNNALDEESGLPAIYHVLCNAAFLAIKHNKLQKNIVKGTAYYHNGLVTYGGFSTKDIKE